MNGAVRDYGTAVPVLDARAALGECPLWSPTEQALYWVDISGCAIHRFDPATGADAQWPMPCEPGCIALAASGGLVAALRDGFYRHFPRTGVLRRIAAAPYDAAGMRFNDGRCDAAGRFWAGAMLEARTSEAAGVHCLERGVVRDGWGPAQGLGVKVSNGLAFSPDGRSVFQSDTPNHVIYRFDYDMATGTASGRSVFARLPDDRSAPAYGGRPDGAAVDRDGYYWSALYEGGRVLRYDPQGRACGEVRIPALRCTMVAFGGAELKTLYVTSARDGASPGELQRFPGSGGLFACDLDVAGLPEPSYAGE